MEMEQVLFLHYLNNKLLESKENYLEELIALKKEYEEFVYIVSHDLKSPMRAISNISNWIEEDLEDSENQTVLDNFVLLKNRVGRLESMMNSLLELSRVSRFEMETYEINIPAIIEESIATIPASAEVQFHFDYRIKNENIETLGKKIQKVVSNLIDNAIRFHDKEIKNIFITAEEHEDEYLFTIKDDGPGIPEEVSAKIFTIFYTVSAKDAHNTTGAGLSIASKIVKMVGGKLSYGPAEPSGSVFKFNWPKIIKI
jgi:signal transduction histidine kinase